VEQRLHCRLVIDDQLTSICLHHQGSKEKLFREQLTYYEDINYEEEVEYLVSEPSKDEIKKYLTKIALQ